MQFRKGTEKEDNRYVCQKCLEVAPKFRWVTEGQSTNQLHQICVCLDCCIKLNLIDYQGKEFRVQKAWYPPEGS